MMSRKILALLALPALASAFSGAFMPATGARIALRSAATSAIAPARVATPTLGLSMQVGDENKLFVGGLPWALDSEDLKEVFQEFGDIEQANVVYDRETGRSKGFGFVAFTEKDAA